MNPKPRRVRGFCKLCRLLKKRTPACKHPTYYKISADVLPVKEGDKNGSK